MTYTRHPKYAVIPLILTLFACGCGQDMPVSGKSATSAAIELCFAPNATMQESITDIEITVSDPGSDEILETKLVHIDDTDREEQLIETSIQLPVAIPLNITVTAFESDCPILEFRGEVEIDPDEDDPVVIPVELSPLQMVFSISSEQDRVNPGDTYVLNIYVQDASRLVSFVCEIGFDEDLMELLEIEAGPLLADKVGLLNLVDYLDIEENSSSPVALGFTGRADIAEKICGSGNLFRLSFRTKDIGTADFGIIHDSVEVWVLKNNDFEEVRDSEQTKIVTEHSVVIE
ncbi:cohesin domain-containing protein [Candidatus Poribacteria bacterium]